MTTAPIGESDPSWLSPNHHPSHRGLISRPPTAALHAEDVDAIIVPTARHAAAMRPAIMLAAKLGCTLVALCSKWSDNAAVLAAAKERKARIIAINAHQFPPTVMPRFETSDLLAGTMFERRTDTSAKRNLGLLLARLTGWRRVVFLDDDISIPEPIDLREAAGLTDTYAGVGLSIEGYPDNSVVCHAYRDAGGPQDMFIGGGALAIGPGSMNSFFPNIYNEDWFFLLDNDGLRPVTNVGRAVQKAYDPYARPLRARLEELGDCLAEGLFSLLDTGRSIRDADFGYWQNFLRRRAGFITEVIDMVRVMPGDAGRRERMLASLKAARGRCQSISPQLCVAYVGLWRADRHRWQQHLNRLRRLDRSGGDPLAVLSALGLGEQTRFLEVS